MIGIIKESDWPHYKMILSFGHHSFANVSTKQFSEEIVFKIRNENSNLSELVEKVINNSSIKDLATNKNYSINEKIDHINSMLIAENSSLTVKGAESQETMVFGIPTCFTIDFGKHLKLYLDPECCYYDSSSQNYKIGYFYHEGRFIENFTEKSDQIIKFPNYSSIEEKVMVVNSITNFRITGFSLDGSIYFSARLLNEGRLEEKEFFTIVDSKNKVIEFCKMVNQDEFALLCLKQQNETARKSMELLKPVVKFGNNLIQSIKSFKINNSNNIIRIDYELVNRFRILKVESRFWQNFLDKSEKKSYDLMKKFLQRNLALSDSLGAVNTSSSKDLISFIAENMFSVQLGNFSAKVANQERIKIKFSAIDDLALVEKNELVKAKSVRQLIEEIKIQKLELIAESNLLRADYINNYGTVYGILNQLFIQRNQLLVNQKLANSLAKVYIDQKESIENLQVRSWWNNSLMGTVGCFIKSTRNSNGFVQFDLDEQKLRRAYNAVSKSCYYKYAKCDYWVITRSGSFDHDYFGRGSTDRTRNDWRYESNDCPVTIPASTLANLQLSFPSVAPLTATKQGYVQCGKFKTVVSPVHQPTRPRITSTEFCREFKKVLENLSRLHWSVAQLVTLMDEEVRAVDVKIFEKALELGEIEQKLFMADNISSAVFELEQKERILEKLQNPNRDNIPFEAIPNEDSVELPAVVAYEIENSLSVQDLNNGDITEVNDDGSVNIAKTLENAREYLSKSSDFGRRLKSELHELAVINEEEKDVLVLDSTSYQVKFEMLSKITDNRRLEMELIPILYESKEKIRGILANGYSVSESDISLIYYLSKLISLDKEVVSKIQNMIGVEKQELERMFNRDFHKHENLRMSFSFTTHSLVSFFIFNNRLLPLDQIFLFLRSNSKNVSQDQGFVNAGFLAKMMEEVIHVG